MNIFGQNPADVTGAIFKSKNLSDIPDKVAARNNLNVPSKDDVLYNAIPIGMILPYWGNTAPSGFLPCSGQTITSSSFPELVTFLGGTTSAVIPDLRGEFLRGWDNGRGVDSGRSFGTGQLDALQNITGSYFANNGVQVAGMTAPPDGAFQGVSGTVSLPGGAATTAAISMTFDASRVARTSTETRPRNVAVLYCIKAYNSITNYSSNFNVTGLVNDFSVLSSSALRSGDYVGANQILNETSGYQKLPGGLVLQWGKVSFTGPGTKAFTFPLTFPNAILSATATLTESTIYSWASQPFTTTSRISNSVLNVYSGYSSNSVVYIIAVGY